MRYPVTILVLLLAAPPAFAEGDAYRNCTCRANGQSYLIGSRICLTTGNGERREAECRMQQNVTSWVVGGDGCAETAERPRLRSPAAG